MAIFRLPVGRRWVLLVLLGCVVLAVVPVCKGEMEGEVHPTVPSAVSMDSRSAAAAAAATPSSFQNSTTLAEVKETEEKGEENEKEPEGEEGGDDLQELSMGILFLSMLIFLGGTAFLSFKDKIPLPYTVILFLYGIVVGAIARWVYPEVSQALGSIPPELLFYIFLPVLIFEGSYAMNIHALRRVFAQTVLLATLGIVINTALLALVVKLLFGWSWYAALLLGSLLSATDPVAVVSLLKGLQVDKRVTAMVDGEAVMNDGTAIIIFSLLLPAAKVGSMTQPAWLIFLRCLQLSFLPLLLGPLFGFIQSFWLRKTSDALTRACITVSVTYVSYYIANTMIGASGVLTLFFEGMFLSYYYPSQFPGKEGNLIYSTWEFLVHLGNTILFSLVGVILVEDVFPTLQFADLFYILVLYISMVLARFAMLELLLPVLNRISSFKVDQRTVVLLVHAGLRGGVAATLALAVFQEGLVEGVAVLKMTCGVVFCTLVINAPTSATVVKLLRFNSKEKYKCIRMNYGLNVLEHSRDAALQRMKRDTKYRNAEWLQIENYLSSHLENPYKGFHVLEDSDEKSLNRLLMSALKTSMWRQHNEHVLSETIMIEVGRVLAKKIEEGELFELRDMQFYHKVLQGPPVLFGKKKSAAKSESSAAGVSPTSQKEQGTTHSQEGRAPAGEEEAAFNMGVEVHRFVPPRLMQEEGEETTLVVPSAGEAEVQIGEDRDAMLAAFMERLLPTWVMLAERFLFGKGYFKQQHQRAQENAFMALLSISKSLAALNRMKYRYATTRAEASRIDRWQRLQLYDVNAAIRFFYKNFHQATHNVASQRAVLSLANSLQDTVEELHSEHGFDRGVTEALEHLVHTLRVEIPAQWEVSEMGEDKVSTDLVTRAVAATSLGRGMRLVEVQAITAMGIVRHLSEDDVIRLPNSAFLIVIFGTIKALHGAWTTIADHETTHNFGDTVGLDSFLVNRSEQQRQWRVLSTDATILIVGFNSIRPFLMERSLRSVRALWRGVACEVLLPFLNDMISPTEAGDNKREFFIEMIMRGKPIIGDKACNECEYNLPYYFVFYLRGGDKLGLFGKHSLPQHIPSFYATQLTWVDTQTVLYVVPVSMTNTVYMPFAKPVPPRPSPSVRTADTDHHHSPSPSPSRATTAEEMRMDLPRVVSTSMMTDSSVHSTTDSATDRFDQLLNLPMESLGPSNPLTSDTAEILDYLLQGQLPENDSDDMEYEDDEVEEMSPHLPIPRSTPRTSSFLATDPSHLCYNSRIVSIFQDITEFVTPVPCVNTLFTEFAYYLERLCVAAYRYVKYPFERNNVVHARRASQGAIEYLLSFGVELSLLKRGIRYLASSLPDIQEMGAEDQEKEDVNDAAFLARIVTWSRNSAFTHNFHLKRMIIEMNIFANRRFKLIKQVLTAVVVHWPELKEVYTMEDLNNLILGLEGEKEREEHPQQQAQQTE